PTEADARAALEIVKSHYAALVPEVDEEARFKEHVEIRTLPVAAALWRATPHAAAEALLGAADDKGASYRIRPGETAWEIARRAHLSLDALQRLNPGIALHPLRAGTALRLHPAPRPPVTVLVQRHVRTLQAVPFPTEKKPSAQMFAGKHFLL